MSDNDWFNDNDQKKNRQLFQNHDKKKFAKYGLGKDDETNSTKRVAPKKVDYHDPTVDEVTEDKIKKEKNVFDNPQFKLTDEQIKQAQRLWNPISVSERFPDEVKNVGKLFKYQVEVNKDGSAVRETDKNGNFHDKLFKDNHGNYVLDKEVKWDKNIEYDIKRGLEAYDHRETGVGARQSFEVNAILNDASLNRLFQIVMDDIAGVDIQSVNDMLIVQYKDFGLIRFSQGPNDWENERLLYKSSVDPLITLIKARAGLKITEHTARKPQINGSIVYPDPIKDKASKYVGKQINFRVATGTSQYGMFIVLRRQGITFNSLDQLDLPAEIKSDMRRAVAGKDGLTIVGGPVGSGKTTLMTTSLNERLRQTNGSVNIISLEKPIETPTPGIIQEEIDEDYGMDWSTGIESALREAPTILRVGEVNEKPAAKAIVRGANSGIVAMTTMHIRSVLEVFETLKDYDISENEIKNSLRLVIYLNRVPRLCPYCRRIDSAFSYPEANKWIDRHLNKGESGAISNLAIRNPDGCDICRKNQNDTNLYGTLGKVGVYELLRVNEPLLMLWRMYQDKDLYVLKDRLINPEKIRVENPDATTLKDKYVPIDPEKLTGLDYHPIEEDVLTKLRNYDIDINTAKYLLNE